METHYKPGEEGFQTLKLPTADRVVGGRVQDAEGRPLADLQVTLYGTSSPEQHETTDAQGHFHFSHVVAEPLFLFVRRKENEISPRYTAQVDDEDQIIVPQFPVIRGTAASK